jgi:5'-AMP-activated protein kinase catalytic alpha subunit
VHVKLSGLGSHLTCRPAVDAAQVVHRDIKLENILLDSNRAMKLIDFGLAAFYAPGKKLRVHCGSPSYAAPEIVARKQYEGPPVDVWSLGVVLFAMLAGFLPFHSPTGNKQVRAA